MNIAVFTDSCLPYCSGVTHAVLAQTRELCSRGHAVTIFRPRPARRFRRQPVGLPSNATMREVPVTFPAPQLPELRIVIPTVVTSLRHLHVLQPDIIHVHTEWGCGWEGLTAAKLLGVPVMGTFHTFFAEPGYLKSIGLPTWLWMRKIMWRYVVGFFNRCDAVTSPSGAVRKALLDHGLRTDPIVISNGIADPPFVRPQWIREHRERLGIDGPSFIYVGRLSREKSLDQLVLAFRSVCDVIPTAKLVLVGDGPCRIPLDRLIADLGLVNHVVRLGFVPHEQLIGENVPLLGDAFVTASTTENQPISVLEAMSFGRPIIGPRAHGLCEMIEHGTNGLVFEPNDVQGLARQMISFAQSQSSHELMGAAAKQFAKQHSLALAVDRLEALYHELAVIPRLIPAAAGNRDAA